MVSFPWLAWNPTLSWPGCLPPPFSNRNLTRADGTPSPGPEPSRPVRWTTSDRRTSTVKDRAWSSGQGTGSIMVCHPGHDANFSTGENERPAPFRTSCSCKPGMKMMLKTIPPTNCLAPRSPRSMAMSEHRRLRMAPPPSTVLLPFTAATVLALKEVSGMGHMN